MTSIYYNSVILRDCETKSFDQEVEYDESNTDVLYSRFRIRVASTLTAYMNPAHASTIQANGLAVTDRAADMHARLSENRKDFWMVLEAAPTSDDVQLDPITGQPTNVASRVLLMATGITAGDMLTHPEGVDTVPRLLYTDCENGPSPKMVSITQIFGGRAMRVEFEIVVCRKICRSDFSDSFPEGLQSGQELDADNRILSNRWSLEETKDENWVTTKVLQGTLRVKHSSYWPHIMRGLCIPSLLNGYHRVRQSFVDNAANLTLKYRVEDRQFHASPPPPAVSWTGHHMETSTENGTINGAEVQVRLTGPPGVDKVQLIGAAGKVLVSRIQGLIPERGTNGSRSDNSMYLKSAFVHDVMHDPVIELRVQVMYSSPAYKWLALRVREMGKSMANLSSDPTLLDENGNPVPQPYTIDDYNPRVWPAPRPYDSESPSGIFSCYLQHPCSVWHDVPGGVLPGEVTEIEETAPPSPGETVPPDSVFYVQPHVLPEDETDLAAHYPNDPVKDIYSFPYVVVEIQNRYVTSHGWVSLPLARQAAAGQASAVLTKMHGGACRRVMTMTVSRDGLQPIIPPAVQDQVDVNGIREVFESEEVELLAPTLNPGGQGRRYAIRLLRTFLLDRPPTAAEKLRTGASPLDRLTASDHLYDLSVFTDQSGQIQ